MRTIKYLLLLFFPLSLTLSCSKFLDVQPEDQVLQEKLFASDEGVRIAVNGVYKLLSTREMYGENLSWGLLSAIGYNYEVNYLPNDLQLAAQFDWESAPVQSRTEAVWQKSFNILANVNNIIQEVEKKDSSFFAEKGWEKKMILGEMYGLRGMVHFELLRIFSPAPATGYAGETIPYVSAYPTYQPARLSMPAIFDTIIGDMKHAQTLLADVDTVYLRNVMRGGRYRSNFGWIELPQGDFFNFRAQRMNFFAATGLLARIYMYKGDYQDAELSAKLVYDYQKKNWFRWTQAFNQGQISDVDYVYTKRPDELMLCFSNAKNFDNYETAVNAGGLTGSLYYSMNDMYMQKLFEGDLDDYRIVGWYNRYNSDFRYLTWARPRGNSYYADVVTQDQGPLLPVMRFTEMYHILVECYNRAGRTADAVTILNELRLQRGAKTKISAGVSSDQLMEILVRDVVRETLTEGQTFFLFKRLNRNIFNGETDRVMNPKDWYAPLPYSEVAYQL